MMRRYRKKKGHQTEAPHQTVTHEEVPQGDEHPCEESAAKTDLKPLRLVGEAFGTYIIAERNCEELVLIDKHAAHERMLYEKLKNKLRVPILKCCCSRLPLL